jgi:hypothetical protein
MQQQQLQAMLAGMLGILCLILVVALVIAIFYLLTLQKALSRVAPRNRLMEPGLVWLMLIPCVNFVWQFFIAIQVPDSLRNEFRDRGRDDGTDYGKGIALGQAILGIVSAVIGNAMGMTGDPQLALAGNAISGIMSLIGLILFIVFWVKIAGYSAQLAADGGYDRDRRDYDDDYDDDDRDRDRPRGGSPDTFKEGDQGRYR